MKNIITATCCFLIMAACNNSPSEPKATEEAAVRNMVRLTESQLSNTDIQTGPIQQKAISSLLRVNGKIDVPPTNMVSVCVPLGGYLKSTKLLEGMHIRKGEIIAVMEDQQYIQLQQDYLTAKTYLQSLEKEYHRQKDLNVNKASSDKIFEKAQAEYTAQKILIRSLSEKLRLISIDPDNLNEHSISRDINIYAPIDGFVSAIKMNVGKYVNPTDVMFELVNPSDIHLALTVFEKDIDKLYIGQKIIAYNNHEPDKKYHCEVILIGKDISPERAITVHCHFEQYDKSLLPGMYMNAEVEVSTHKAYVIPNEGLVRFEGKEFVFIPAGNGTYRMQEVITRNSENGYTQIAFPGNDTINPEQPFVLKGAYTLLMKMKNTDDE